MGSAQQSRKKLHHNWIAKLDLNFAACFSLSAMGSINTPEPKSLDFWSRQVSNPEGSREMFVAPIRREETFLFLFSFVHTLYSCHLKICLILPVLLPAHNRAGFPHPGSLPGLDEQIGQHFSIPLMSFKLPLLHSCARPGCVHSHSPTSKTKQVPCLMRSILRDGSLSTPVVPAEDVCALTQAHKLYPCNLPTVSEEMQHFL